MINCGVKDNFTIWYANHQVGNINIVTKFTPEGSDEYEDAKKRLED